MFHVKGYPYSKILKEMAENEKQSTLYAFELPVVVFPFGDNIAHNTKKEKHKVRKGKAV